MSSRIKRLLFDLPLISLFILACSSGLPQLVVGQATPAPTGNWTPPTYSSLAWIGVNGTHFCFDNGTYVVLHGVDYSGAEVDDFTFTPQDFEAMASWGFNVIRMPIAWSFVEPKPGVYDQTYLNEVKEAVQMANRYGIYVIIDMHQWHWSPVFTQMIGSTTNGLPSWAVPYQAQTKAAEEKDKAYFWSNATVEEEFASMWGYVASQFANDSGVLGYDLFNEPTTPTNWTDQEMYQNMARVYDMAISAIRKVDTRHVIFFETSDWDAGTDPSYWVKPDDPYHELALEVHDYWSNPLSAPLFAALSAGKQWDIPVYDGEFGGGLNAPGPSISAFDSYGLAWTYWSYSYGAGGADTINYENNPLLGLLAEPYPRLSSSPVSSFQVENETNDQVVTGVLVKVSFSGQKGWVDFFVPSGFNATSPGTFNPVTRTFNATFYNGSYELSLRAPPGYGMPSTVFTIVALPNPVPVGYPSNVTAWISFSNGVPLADEVVDFYANGTEVGRASTNSQGMVVFRYVPDRVGNATVRAVVQGFPFIYGNLTLQVKPVTVKPSLYLTVAVSPSRVDVGSPTMLTARAVYSNGSAARSLPVYLYVNGTEVGEVITNSSGLAALSYTPTKPGNYSISCSASGVSATGVFEAVARQGVSPLNSELVLELAIAVVVVIIIVAVATESRHGKGSAGKRGACGD